MHVPAELFESLRKRVSVFSHQSKRLYDGDVDALHRTRVASRRLRELLPILRLDAHTSDKLSGRLRKVTKRLGAVRDFDVLIGLIAEMHGDRRYSNNALTALQGAVEEQQRNARERLEAKLPPAKVQRLTRRLKRVARHLEPDGERSRDAGMDRAKQTSVWVLEARATRRAARVREAIDAAGTVYVPGPLHQVRIALKKLRFALELKAEINSQRTTRDIAALKSSQDLLGRLHDLQALIDHAREMQTSQSGPDLTASRELAALVRTLESDCRKLHARYIRTASSLIVIAENAGGSKAAAARVARRELRREQRPA
jgi:CHAD domain-containing protein